MMIANRESFAASARRRLPYDAEVEWISAKPTAVNTGIYGINTLVVPSQQTYMRLRIMRFSAPSGIGKHGLNGGGGANGRCAIGVGLDRLYFGLANINKDITGVSPAGRICEMTLDMASGRVSWAFDGAAPTVQTISHNAYSTTSQLFLFCALSNLAEQFPGRLYSAEIRDAGQLVRDYVPVRIMNEQGVSEGALYDRVTGRLFRNASTGTFAFGTDVAGGGGDRWLSYCSLSSCSFSTRLWKEAA